MVPAECLCPAPRSERTGMLGGYTSAAETMQIATLRPRGRNSNYWRLSLPARVRINLRFAVDMFSKYLASFRIDLDWLV